MTERLRVIYMLLHFPYLTETFVAEEIRALRAQGIDVEIVSLLAAGKGPQQQVSQSLQPYCHYAPPLHAWQLWWAQLAFQRLAPRRYWSLFLTLFIGVSATWSPVLIAKRLLIFLKAVAVAYNLRQRKVALLHAHFAWLPGAAAWICAELLDRPFTVTTHAYDLYASTDLLALVANKAAHVVTISDYNRTYLIKHGICPPSKVSVIHCGIDLTRLSLPAVGEPMSRETEWQGEQTLRIISVGSLNEKKGHHYLIEACKQLKAQGLQFNCTIVGSGVKEAALLHLVERLGLQHEVKLLGALPNHEVMQLYTNYDIFVLAAAIAPNGDRDGIPVVMIEAGAHGLPIVSTEVSGIPELVQPNVTGLLVPPQDVTALADAIRRLAEEPLLRKELGRNVQALIAAEFDSFKNTQKLLNLFRHVTDAKLY